jgi:hypothetical protein
MAQQATDTFVIELDGTPVGVEKGTVLPEGHPVLKALGETHLFRALIEDVPKPGAKTARTPKGAGGG